jgi:hypothetical protein
VEFEFDHSSLSSVHVKNEWSHLHTPKIFKVCI